MNKGVIIGIIIAVVIVAGAIALAQNDDKSDTIIVTDMDNGETKPKSFEVGLQESVGMAEKP